MTDPYDASKFDFSDTSLSPEEVIKCNDAIMTLITARVVESHYPGEDPSIEGMRKTAKIELKEAGGEDLFSPLGLRPTSLIEAKSTFTIIG